MTRLALVVVLAAQIPTPAPAPAMGPVPPDPVAAVAPRGLAAPPPAEVREAPARLDALRDDPAFQYDRPEAETPSLWDRFWAWAKRTFLDPIGQGASKPIGYGLMALAAGVLVWVLVRVLRGEGSGLFGRQDVGTAEASGPLLDVEDIETVDLASRLRQSLRDGDHRSAIRLRYLLALQRLARDGHVEWARDKTNRTYVSEARASAGADAGRAVADVTRVFDHVWYGGLGVDAARYERFAARFDRLDALLDGLRVGVPA